MRSVGIVLRKSPVSCLFSLILTVPPDTKFSKKVVK